MGGIAPGRRFGLEIGALCIAIALLLMRRGAHPIAEVALWLLGAGLAIAAMLRPSLLDPTARAWSRIGAPIAAITTPLMLSVVYFVVITPMALLRRTFGRSPITRDRDASSHWARRTTRSADQRRAEMERQF
jgi:hypothetical protein